MYHLSKSAQLWPVRLGSEGDIQTADCLNNCRRKRSYSTDDAVCSGYQLSRKNLVIGHGRVSRDLSQLNRLLNDWKGL